MSHSPSLRFKFLPAKFCWVALHPEPIGTVYFVGGAFFGSLPTVFYRFLLKGLFLKGYTVVALPFKFSFRHWSIALGLVENQDEIRQCLLEEAQKLGYSTAAYQSAAADTSAEIREYWVGHSLGCKYIALMELLTDYEIFERQDSLRQCLSDRQVRVIDQLIDKTSLESVSLYNQPSVLLDPVVSDLDNAIPLKSVRSLFTKLIKVLPSRQETFCLISQSRLFALTSILAFDSQLAASSVTQLQQILSDRLVAFQPFRVKPSRLGNHLAAVGISRGDNLLIEAVLDLLHQSRSRSLEATPPAAVESANSLAGSPASEDDAPMSIPLTVQFILNKAQVS